MSIVEYFETESGRFFDPKLSVKKGWGLDIDRYSQLSGLKLVDRKNKKHLAEIEKVEHPEDIGIAIVYWKCGGYNCLDHVIEQFKPTANTR